LSNNFAVSSSDISTALTKQSASLHAYGNDMNEVIGMVTAGAEILTGNASKTARGIKTIGANIVKMAQSAKTLDIQVKGATKTIQLWNEEGTDILSTYDVLKQIAVYWKDMTDAERSALAIQQSGKNQLDVYTALLGNFSTAIKATETAMRSDGSAIKENTAYMESLEAHTKALKQQFELFLLGEGGLNSFLKSVLDSATSTMKFMNSIGGLSTVLKGLSTIIGVVVTGALAKAIQNFNLLNSNISISLFFNRICNI
jgi:TP901 family phage tail tape measure protein